MWLSFEETLEKKYCLRDRIHSFGVAHPGHKPNTPLTSITGHSILQWKTYR